MISRRRWLFILLFAIIICVLVNLGIRLAIIHSIYDLNLHTQYPLSNMVRPKSGEKILIFAPHEDDETLGCAGYIQEAVAVGAKISVVLMTNGEYPEIDVVLFEERFLPSPDAFIRLGYMRQKETLAALKYLGVPASQVTFLGYPNQYMNLMWQVEHWLPDSPVRSARTRTTRSPYDNSLTKGAIYCGQSLLEDVKRIIIREKPDVVITLHPNDVHVDHWPTYTFVRFALEELSLGNNKFAQNCQVYSYLIHRDLWPQPRSYRPRLKLMPPFLLAGKSQNDWTSFPITSEDTKRKYRAIGFYRTQGGDYDPLLRSFARSNELFCAIPTQSWKDKSTVTPRLIIQDPVGDLVSSAANPQADIRSVYLARIDGRISIRVETREPPNSRVGFHVLIHSGEKADKNRSIVQYDYQGGHMDGRMVDHAISSIDPAELRSGISGHSITMTAPWPLRNDAERFFMIKVLTTKGQRTIDQTTTATFRIR